MRCLKTNVMPSCRNSAAVEAGYVPPPFACFAATLQICMPALPRTPHKHAHTRKNIQRFWSANHTQVVMVLYISCKLFHPSKSTLLAAVARNRARSKLCVVRFAVSASTCLLLSPPACLCAPCDTAAHVVVAVTFVLSRS